MIYIQGGINDQMTHTRDVETLFPDRNGIKDPTLTTEIQSSGGNNVNLHSAPLL
jgi:hypothetical protein